ncbi:unnamed protein product [Closterium sp. Naga37s-1]|nr:unnamed protein product [Closterium sp. Naga37s-1]
MKGTVSGAKSCTQAGMAAVASGCLAVSVLRTSALGVQTGMAVRVCSDFAKFPLFAKPSARESLPVTSGTWRGWGLLIIRLPHHISDPAFAAAPRQRSPAPPAIHHCSRCCCPHLLLLLLPLPKPPEPASATTTPALSTSPSPTPPLSTTLNPPPALDLTPIPWLVDRRTAILHSLRSQVAAGRAIIGGGAGTGISAKCEEMGGVDLIVIKSVPVLAGVCATDPFRQMPLFLRRLAALGFAGVQNFPTVGLYDGSFRTNLEEDQHGVPRSKSP